MKKTVLAAVLAIPAFAFGQSGSYTIQGKIGSYNAPAKVYLEYGFKGKMIKDSTGVKNGEFKFTGKASELMNAYLLLNEKGTGISNTRDYKSFFIEPGTILVDGDSSMANAKITGTKNNTDNERYNEEMKPVNDAYSALEAKQKIASPGQDKELKQEQKSIEEKEKNINQSFIKEHPDSYISLTALEMFAYVSDYKDILPLYDGLSENVKQTEAGKQFAARLPKPIPAAKK